MAEQKTHDSRISIVKAICIILMVVGHSGPPIEFNNVFGLVRMPCFFFVSGFLLKEKYLDDTLPFIKRRFKGLWWPFVKWSLIFLALHNFFTYLHLYDTPYTWREMVNKICRIFTLTGSEQLLGGFWFLKELLYASLLGLGSMLLLRKATSVNCFNRWGGVILTILFLLLAYLLSIASFKIPTIGSRTMLSTSFYLAGYWFNKQSFSKQNKLFVGVFCLVIVVGVSFFFQGSMSVKSAEVFIYFIVALIGTYGIVNIAGLIKGRAQRVLDYVGSKTLYILTFHFISFKIVSLIKIWQYDLPIESLSSFPVIGEHNTFYWIIYSIVGVVVPIAIWEIVDYIQHKIENKKSQLNYGKL